MPRSLDLGDVDAVLLDVDGTLVDTTYLHACVWSEAFAELSHPRPTADLHSLIGMDAERLVRTALEGTQPSTHLVDEIVGRHGELYEPMWPRLRPLPGAQLLVRGLHQSGRRVVLASSAQEKELTALRGALDIDEFLDGATSSDDADRGKPAPDIVEQALRVASSDPGRALFVGDAVWDGEAAAKAGVRFVGVTCGGIAAADLRAAGAIEVYSGPAELHAHLGL
ncbi:MAG: superfamily hydrolase [Frankiales bacterium]|nr:superfamily hydrolase [Frankiales bacterium]